jgi:hypothetical protein
LRHGRYGEKSDDDQKRFFNKMDDLLDVHRWSRVVRSTPPDSMGLMLDESR